MTVPSIAALLLAVAACGAPAANEPRVRLDSAEARELLGTDDGFQGVIFYGAELMGSIDGCGCFGTPTAGGVPFRFAYTEGFRGAYPEAGSLQLDAGYSMTSPVDARGRELPDLVAKSDAVLSAFERLGYDAANLTAHDVAYMSRYLRDGGAQRPPFVDRFVSANLEPAAPGLLAPRPYVVRELAGSRVPGGRRHVAIIGITEDAPEAVAAGFRVTDPAAALARTIPIARAESDLVVVLAFLERSSAVALAERFGSEADLFVVAHPSVRDQEPSLGAPPRIAFARYKTMYLGELRLYFDGGTLARARNRYVKLFDPLPRDPLGDRLAVEAKERIKKAQLERFEASEE